MPSESPHRWFVACVLVILPCTLSCHEPLLQFGITFRKLGCVVVKQIKRYLEHEQLRIIPGTGQGLGDIGL